MIKLKEKPISCESCPFGFVQERFVRENGEIKRINSLHCGANRSSADIKNCPIGQI